MTGRPILQSPLLLALACVTLILLSARAALDIRRILSEAEGDRFSGAAEASLDEGTRISVVDELLSGRYWEPPASLDPARNVVDADRLAPRLLHDEEEIADYIRYFPEEEYEIVRVPGLGRFFVDQGTDFIKTVLRSGRAWESHIAEILEKLGEPGTTMIDAGAHIGTHTLTLAQIVGSSGRVYAFEPQRKLFRELVHNLQLNGVTNAVPLRFALGDSSGLVEMDSADAENEGATKVGSGGDEVEMRTIDGFGFANVSLLKIDVEGFEDQVLEGAERTIAESRPVILVEIQGGYDFDTAPRAVRRRIVDTIQAIEAMGYRVVRYTVYDYFALPIPRRALPPGRTAGDPPSAASSLGP